MIETRLASNKVDILILAEGTYPFVRGGVASWIYDIVLNMPEYNFGILFLGSKKGAYKDYAYPIPPNITSFQIIYLFNEKLNNSIGKKPKRRQANIDKITLIHDTFKRSHGCPQGLAESIPDLAALIEPSLGFDYQQFSRSKSAWEYITEQYENHSTDPSFINYFWNIRNMHVPLWTLEEALRHAPVTQVVHTISTGYAGLLAAMLQQRHNYPMILSEHGIYTKERNIELLQTKMFVSVNKLISAHNTFTYQHELWLKFFDSLARTCYHYADPIISLYSSAKNQQILAGAEATRTQVIPNGVDIAKYAAIRRPPHSPIPKIVGFVGRLVRIKDIKTFIRAVAIMCARDAQIVAWIRMVGMADEKYYKECLDYIKLMELQDKICFITEGDMLDILAKVGLLILSSISEGMPLVLLEAMAAGIPVISTDVGSCRDIIEGYTEEDKQLGQCGAVVTIADATMLAEAAVSFLSDDERWFKARQAGIQRVEQYYDLNRMIKAYQDIYQKAIAHGRDRI